MMIKVDEVSQTYVQRTTDPFRGSVKKEKCVEEWSNPTSGRRVLTAGS